MLDKQYLSDLDALWTIEPYTLAQQDKQARLLPMFNLLHQHHQAACPQYAAVASRSFSGVGFDSLASLPYLAVRLFKHLPLTSIADSEIYKTLQSSGTSGQAPARIFLDQATSQRQSKALVKILQSSIGKARLPMLIIDSASVLKDRQLFSARGAGIQGLAFFGRDHTYALNEQMQPDWEAIQGFVDKYADQPVLIFGFTFMVWLYLVQALQTRQQPLGLHKGILLHSGGWKKLEAQRVDNALFKDQVRQWVGVGEVVNFYGMAEQVGSVFVECHEGHLHAPVFADVLVRSPWDLSELPVGREGLLQVLSVLPSSYPGHSLLTEDLGTLLGIDDCPCGRKGKYFSVSGRLPRSELRGCSDTHQGGTV